MYIPLHMCEVNVSIKPMACWTKCKFSCMLCEICTYMICSPLFVCMLCKIYSIYSIACCARSIYSLACCAKSKDGWILSVRKKFTKENDFFVFFMDYDINIFLLWMPRKLSANLRHRENDWLVSQTKHRKKTVNLFWKWFSSYVSCEFSACLTFFCCVGAALIRAIYENNMRNVVRPAGIIIVQCL